MRYFFRRTGLDVLSGRFYGWLQMVMDGYGWLLVVMGWYRLILVGYEWLWVVVVGFGVVTGGNRWF